MPEPPLNPTPGPSNAQTFRYATFDQVLDDLSCRFILNLPDEELRSIERVCFQVEQAHWFYEDFVREVNPNLPSFNLRRFSAELFRSCPMLQHWSHVHDKAFDQFMAYKVRVPVCGAIMLNDKMDKCVLVKGFKSSSGWGFPKGKINQHEKESDCAAREVLEETGYDVSSQISEDDYFNTIVREQSITLFIVPGVPEDFPFKTRTRKEISKIEWFKLSDLPTWKRKREAPGKFYLITPFIGQLKDFIHRRRKELKAQMQQKGIATADIVKTTNGTNGVNLNILEPRSSSDESATPTKESSSLSSGNVGPTTPSPERLLFYNHENGTGKSEDSLKGMDPHLASLLNNLNVSANGVSEQTQPATNGVTAKDSSENEHASRRGVSPSIESVSSSSIYTAAPSASIAASQTQAQPPPSSAPISNIAMPPPPKRSKHIALLDSVVEDIELSTPIDKAPLPPGPHTNGIYSSHSYPMNGPGRPASVAAYPPYSHPYNHPAAALPHQSSFAPGYQPPHQHQASAVNFPVGRGIPSPSHLDPFHVNPMAHMNPAGIPRPLTSQSQVQMYPGAPHPHGIPPPPLGSQMPHVGMPLPHPPGSHQGNLLALLSPRSRTVSQPLLPSTQPAPQPRSSYPLGPPKHAPRESFYNSYLNGHGPAPISHADVPPLSLSSPLKVSDGLPAGHLRRDTGTNSQLLSILNGKPMPPKL